MMFILIVVSILHHSQSNNDINIISTFIMTTTQHKLGAWIGIVCLAVTITTDTDTWYLGTKLKIPYNYPFPLKW